MSVKKEPTTVVKTDEPLDAILGVEGSVALSAGDGGQKRSFAKQPGNGLEFIDNPGEGNGEEGEGEEGAGSRTEGEGAEGEGEEGAGDQGEEGQGSEGEEGAAAVIDQIVEEQMNGEEGAEGEGEEGEEGKNKSGRKPGLHEVLKLLVDDGTVELFEGEDDISKYTNKDAVELIQANIQNKVTEMANNAPLEIFKNLDPKLQDVITYQLKGGKDVVQVLKMVTASQEIAELDIEKPNDQERMVREYYRSLEWSEDAINQKVTSLIDKEELKGEAKIIKPQLDKQQEKQLKKKIEEQDKKQEAARKMSEQFASQIHKALDNPHINGVPLNPRTQMNLFVGMTNSGEFQDRYGNPTNGLGHVLEELQFGENANHPLLLEAFWLMTNPDEYRASLASVIQKGGDAKTFRQLKTTSQKKTTSSPGQGEGKEKATQKRTVKRPQGNRSFMERPKK
jgi:hypothetical protein